MERNQKSGLKPGSTIFITGATSGIGLAAAERFASEGHKLALCGRREDRVQNLQKQFGSKAYAAVLDVAKRDDVDAFLKNLPPEFADINVLVNNAGGALGLESAQNANLDDWDRMVDANIKGLLYVTRGVLPGMVSRGHGHIINIGSIAGEYPYPAGNAYGATKAFVKQFSLNLRADLLGENVRVTNIEPGMTETEFSLVRFKGDTERASQVYQGIEALTAGDIAESIFWCANLPPHVNINRLELMPTMQAFAGLAVKRN